MMKSKITQMIGRVVLLISLITFNIAYSTADTNDQAPYLPSCCCNYFGDKDCKLPCGNLFSYESTDDYAGFFMRSALDQKPGGPRIFGTNNPDIILAPNGEPGTMKDYITTQGYSTDFGNEIIVDGQTHNYIYVRGINTTGAPAKFRFWLYYADANVLLFPATWYDNGIIGKASEINYIECDSINPGQPEVFGPFLLKPSQGYKDHYCIGVIVQKASAPLFPPPSQQLNGVDTPDKLWSELAQDPNIAWRNTQIVQGEGETWQFIANIDGGKLKDPGATNTTPLQIGVKLKNIPCDGYISYYFQGEDGEKHGLRKTKIPEQNAILQMGYNWPDNLKSSLIINYWKGTDPLPSEYDITALVEVTDDTLIGSIISSETSYEEKIKKFNQMRNSLEVGKHYLVLENGEVAGPFPHVHGALGSITFKLKNKSPIAEIQDSPVVQFIGQIAISETGGGEYRIGIECENLSADGYVSFSFNGPDGKAYIFPKSKIVDSRELLTYELNLPNDFTTPLVISYWGPQFTEGAKISEMVLCLEP